MFLNPLNGASILNGATDLKIRTISISRKRRAALTSYWREGQECDFPLDSDKGIVSSKKNKTPTIQSTVMSGSNTSTSSGSSPENSSPAISVPDEVTNTSNGINYIDFSEKIITSLMMGTVLKM